MLVMKCYKNVVFFNILILKILCSWKQVFQTNFSSLKDTDTLMKHIGAHLFIGPLLASWFWIQGITIRFFQLVLSKANLYLYFHHTRKISIPFLFQNAHLLLWILYDNYYYLCSFTSLTRTFLSVAQLVIFGYESGCLTH